MSEFSEFELFQPTQNKPQQGSTTAIIFASFCEVIDVFLLIVVVISSWRDYRRSNRSCSCFGFFRTLALMRKVKTRVVRPIFQEKLSRLSKDAKRKKINKAKLFFLYLCPKFKMTTRKRSSQNLYLRPTFKMKTIEDLSTTKIITVLLTNFKYLNRNSNF